MKNKKLLIAVIMVMIIVFLVGLILCLKTKDKIELKQNTYNLEYGDDIVKEISFYLKDANSTKNIKDYELVYDINKNTETGLIDTGEYVIKIKYKKQVAEGRMIIKDTVAPKFSKAEDVIELEKDNMDVDLTTYFKVEDLDNDIKLNIEGQYDLFKIGEYNLKIIASDSSNNHTCKDFILKVKEKEMPKTTNNSKEQPTAQTNTSKNNNTNSNNSNDTNQKLERYRKDISDMYVRQINEYRIAKGLAELPVTIESQNEADRRAKEIVNNYSHDGSGYGFGENIGDGSIGSDFFTAWKNSPTHNAAMLREENRAIAASVYEANNKWYAVVVFRMNY